MKAVEFFAKLTGLSEEEIKWTLERANQLQKEPLTKEERAAILKLEAQEKFGGGKATKSSGAGSG